MMVESGICTTHARNDSIELYAPISCGAKFIAMSRNWCGNISGSDEQRDYLSPRLVMKTPLGRNLSWLIGAPFRRNGGMVRCGCCHQKKCRSFAMKLRRLLFRLRGKTNLFALSMLSPHHLSSRLSTTVAFNYRCPRVQTLLSSVGKHMLIYRIPMFRKLLTSTTRARPTQTARRGI